MSGVFNMQTSGDWIVHPHRHNVLDTQCELSLVSDDRNFTGGRQAVMTQVRCETLNKLKETDLQVMYSRRGNT
jgi:hypothetical protein